MFGNGGAVPGCDLHVRADLLPAVIGSYLFRRRRPPRFVRSTAVLLARPRRFVAVVLGTHFVGRPIAWAGGGGWDVYRPIVVRAAVVFQRFLATVRNWSFAALVAFPIGYRRRRRRQRRLLRLRRRRLRVVERLRLDAVQLLVDPVLFVDRVRIRRVLTFLHATAATVLLLEPRLLLLLLQRGRLAPSLSRPERQALTGPGPATDGRHRRRAKALDRRRRRRRGVFGPVAGKLRARRRQADRGRRGMMTAVGHRVTGGGRDRAHRVHGYPVFGQLHADGQAQNHLETHTTN